MTKKEANKKLYAEVKAEELDKMAEQEDKIDAQAKTVGRPSTYSRGVASKLCALLAQGKSLRTACTYDGMPSIATVYNWIAVHPEFLEQYSRAKEESADALVEDMLDIADEVPSIPETDKDGKITAVKVDSAGVARNRLRVETRKWIASKLKPKKYSEKTNVELYGKDGGDIKVDHINFAMEGLLATLEKKLGQCFSCSTGYP